MKIIVNEVGKPEQLRGRFLPCPFCGGNHIALDQFSLVTGLPPFPEDHYAYSEDCACKGPGANNTMAATRRWNNRRIYPTKAAT
jgi:hypothetical protein